MFITIFYASSKYHRFDKTRSTDIPKTMINNRLNL